MITSTLVLLKEDCPKFQITCTVGPRDESGESNWFSPRFAIAGVGEISLVLPIEQWDNFVNSFFVAMIAKKPHEGVTSERD